MSCTREREQIILLLHDELDEAGRAGIGNHLDRCGACAAFRETQAGLLRLLDDPAGRAAVDRLLPICRRDLRAALAAAGVPGGAAAAERIGAPSGWRAFRSIFGPRPALRHAFVPVLCLVLAGGFLLGRMSTRSAPEAIGPQTPAVRTVRDIGPLETAGDGRQVRLSYDSFRQTSLEGSARDPEIRRLLVGTLRDSLNDGLRLEAIDALRGMTADDEVRDALLHAMDEDDNAGARLKALEALRPAAGSDPAVRRALLRIVQSDANPGVRVRAVDALGAARDPEALPVLRRLAAEDRNDYVRLRAASLAGDWEAGR